MKQARLTKLRDETEAERQAKLRAKAEALVVAEEREAREQRIADKLESIS